MRTRRLVGRALRYGTSRAWAGVRPGRVTDLRARAERPVDLEVRPPRPDEAYVPATVATGPWEGVDPLVADAWYSRTASLVSLAMWAFIGWRVQREYRAGAERPGNGDESAPDTPA